MVADYRGFLIVVCSFLIAWPSLGESEVREPAIPKIVAERAPGELASVRARDVLIAAGDKGRELYVYSPKTGEVQRYTEKGDAWGDPVPLHRDLLHPGMTFIRMDVSGGRLALSGSAGFAVFAADDGELIAQNRIFQPGDVAALPGGDFALSLTNLPHPLRKGAFLARGAFGDEVPRLAIYDDDGEVTAKALLESEERSPSGAVARALRVTWGERRLWAGEVGSYRIAAFDRDLDPRELLHDPGLDFQPTPLRSGAGGEESAPPDREVPNPGRDLGGEQRKPKPPVKTQIHVKPVMVDLDWGESPGRLYVLLDPASFGGRIQIDLFDPVMAEVRRSTIVLPDGVDQTLTQMTVGSRFVWLRGYVDGSPILRVDRTLLDQGTVVKMTGAPGLPV